MSKTAPTWRNRIVAHGEEAPDQLLANPLNARIHSQAQQAVMQETLEELGWLDEVIVSRATGLLINGHMRVMLALSHEEPTVPVKYVELTPEEEVKAVTLFDAIGSMAVLDPKILNQALEGISTARPALMQTLSGLHALANNLPQMDRLFPEGGLRPAAPPLGQAPEFAGGGAPDDPALLDAVGYGQAGAEGAGYGAEGGAISESHVRMVQLFLDTTTHPVFQAREAALRAHFATDNMTDTVMAALEYAVAQLGL